MGFFLAYEYLKLILTLFFSKLEWTPVEIIILNELEAKEQLRSWCEKNIPRNFKKEEILQ